MDVQERIRRGYHAIGPGSPRDVLALFHQDQATPPEWVVRDWSLKGRLREPQETVALDLFPAASEGFELIGVELRSWDFHESRARLVIGGRYRTRMRGSWDVVALPFIHIWSFAGDQVESVTDYLGGLEVLRREAVTAPRRWTWSWHRRHAA
jgi:hypothetical protein